MLDTKIHRTGLRQMAEGSSRATSEDYARWGVANSSDRKGLQANINGGHRPICLADFREECMTNILCAHHKGTAKGFPKGAPKADNCRRWRVSRR